MARALGVALRGSGCAEKRTSLRCPSSVRLWRRGSRWSRSTAATMPPLPLEGINMSAPVILITGALTGIGRATALAFAREGATVVVSGRREQAGKALEAELHGLLQGHGAEVAFIQADVRHEDEVRRLVDQTVARFGRLDVAVNNA